MRTKNVLVAAAILGLTTASVFVLNSCSRGAHQESNIDYYTCPMHHQIHMDHPGNCPICGMTLVPVYTSPPAPLLNQERGAEGGVRISPERQRLIGLKTVKAERKTATSEIRTTGRAAFDPELAVAQREFLEISKNVPSLKQAARSNLRLKGMSEDEIKDLEKQGKTNAGDFYLPDADGALWIYATLFQEEMDRVQPGDTATVSLPSDPSVTFEGTVKSVDPVVDSMTRSVRARILLPDSGGKIRPNTFVNVTLKSDLGEALLVPSSAILDSGERRIAFVRVGDRFETREVSLGSKSGDDVVVKSGLSEGEDVVTGAAFLVDSESQLKAALP